MLDHVSGDWKVLEFDTGISLDYGEGLVLCHNMGEE
jgi:hypothetical protein